MLFTRPEFLFLFLPVVLTIYYILNHKYRNVFLLFSSIVFYTRGEGLLVLLMLAVTAICYYSGLLMEKGRKKLGFRLALFSSLGALFVFKYFYFVKGMLLTVVEIPTSDISIFDGLSEIVLPLGISFYVFQNLSYILDLKFGNTKASRNFVNYSTYITMFSQLVAGPIVRYVDIQKQLLFRSFNPDQFLNGVKRFVIGLAKKIIIANNCAFIADNIFILPIEDIDMVVGWVGIIAYTLQIYFDFSGYSDMAIGLGKMFGFDFLENFNYPFISKSIREFWRRWHISLSTWFKDYLYIPIGGSRQNGFLTYRNLFIVFVVTGLWHGASMNFLIWGLLHGLLIVNERLWFGEVLKRVWAPIAHLYLIFFVLITFVFFRLEELPNALNYFKHLFQSYEVTDYSYLYYLLSYERMGALILGILFSLPVVRLFYSIRLNYLGLYKVAKVSWLLLLFIISVFYIAGNSYNPFIYFKF
ncbi:MAG: MBOAT family protein [Marinilabiliaceae bacterium]|nr:MBOAT family protein [Marinilabiliaceae bacterium]